MEDCKNLDGNQTQFISGQGTCLSYGCNVIGLCEVRSIHYQKAHNLRLKKFGLEMQLSTNLFKVHTFLPVSLLVNKSHQLSFSEKTTSFYESKKTEKWYTFCRIGVFFGTNMPQCAPGIFNLDQKFQRRNLYF